MPISQYEEGESIPVSMFKSDCQQLIEEVTRSREPTELTRRGKPVALLSAVDQGVDWTRGAFRESIRILGDIESDLADLGAEREAMR